VIDAKDLKYGEKFYAYHLSSMQMALFCPCVVTKATRANTNVIIATDSKANERAFNVYKFVFSELPIVEQEQVPVVSSGYESLSAETVLEKASARLWKKSWLELLLEIHREIHTCDRHFWHIVAEIERQTGMASMVKVAIKPEEEDEDPEEDEQAQDEPENEVPDEQEADKAAQVNAATESCT